MEPVSLFGAGTVGKSAVVTSQRRLNCYIEVRPDGDKSKHVVYGRPGLASYLTLSPTPNGPIRGAYATDSFLHSVAGTTYYKYDRTLTANSTNTGTITTDSNPVGIVHGGTELLLVDGAQGHYVTNADSATASALTAIASANFPDAARTCTFLGGRFVVEDPASPGRFRWSSSYDVTTWAALDFATAEQTPDTLRAVDSDHGHLILFGPSSVEWWQVSGALDSPYAPVIPATQQWGLAATYSRAHLDNTVYFLAQNRQGQVQVARFSGYNVERVSDSDLENIINGFSTVEDAVASSSLIDGHPLYTLTFPTADRSFEFDASALIWSEKQTGASNIPARFVGQHSVAFNGFPLVSHKTSPIIYKVSPTTYTDGGEVIKRLIQSRHIRKDGNRFTIDEIYLDMETGVGLVSGQGSDPQIVMQVSKDGGRSWGVERWADIGAMGEHKTRAIWRRLGSSEDFVFRFYVTDPVKFVITGGYAKVRARKQ